MIGAAGISHPVHLTRRHIVRRLSSSEIRLADQIFPHVEPGALFTGEPIEDPRLDVYWNKVSGDSFNFEGSRQADLTLYPQGLITALTKSSIKAARLSGWARVPRVPPNANHQTGRLD